MTSDIFELVDKHDSLKWYLDGRKNIMRYDSKEYGSASNSFVKSEGLRRSYLLKNVSPNTVAKIESGLRRPSIDLLLELSEFFGVSTNYLVLGIQPEDMGNGSLKETIDEAITQIDITIEKLLAKKEELLKMKRSA